MDTRADPLGAGGDVTAVRVRLTPDGARVELFGEVIHATERPVEAQRVARWVQFQLRRGAIPAEIRGALRGEPMEGPGEGLLLAQARACHGLLGGTVPEIRRAVDSGAVDRDLGALLEAERLGARRAEVLALLSERRLTRRAKGKR